jgi:hypothetical protein
MDATLGHGSTGDRLVFTFGARPPEAIAEPTIGIVFTEPPFSMAGSGEPVTVTGDRFLKVRMGGMVVARPDGAPVYTGQRDLLLLGGTIPEAVMTDEFEGVVTWIVGLTGTGCPMISTDSSGADKLIIELAEGQGFGPATWALDPAYPAPGPDTTELHLLVWERACHGFVPETGRMSPPALIYTEATITITIGVRPLGGVNTCPLPPGSPTMVSLAEPLGARSLLDGGLDPPAPPSAPG